LYYYLQYKKYKKALDDNKFVAAILMDLSKAFDCLPHNLLLLKLKTYGLSDSALDLLFSYLHIIMVWFSLLCLSSYN
jgi:hypothetical protein